MACCTIIDPESPSPKNRAVQAVRWTLLGNILQRLLTFGAVAVLARLLTETEFGAYRQLLSVHLVLFVLLPLGFDQLYIREVARRSRFVMLLGGALSVTAAALAIVMLAGHVLIVRWMDFAPWSAMLWIAPAIVALQAWKLIYKTELAARLAYREISVGEIIYAMVTSIFGVALALVWPTAWSLYAAYALAEIAELIWLRRVSKVSFPPLRMATSLLWRYGGRWRRFGIFHCGNQVFNALGGNAPTIILGAALSKAAAASFSMANWLITIPIYILIGALHRVAFSVLAGRNKQQLVSPVVQMLKLSAAFIVPVLIWVAVMAEPIVAIVLGEKWVDSTAPIARMLSMYCVFAALFSPVSSLDILLDRPDYGFYWNVVATAIRVGAVVWGLQYSVTDAVLWYASASAVMWLIWGTMLADLLGAGQWVFHRPWLIFVPLWLVLAILLVGSLTIADNPWVLLVISGVPAVIYAGLLWKLHGEVTRQGLGLFKLSRRT